MFAVVKFLHFLALMLGATASIANVLIAWQLRRSGGPAGPQAALRPLFGLVGLAGIVAIWITGVWLWLIRYDGYASYGAFQLKLIVAAALLGLIAWINLKAVQARKQAMPVPAWMPAAHRGGLILLVVAVGLAVLAFN